MNAAVLCGDETLRAQILELLQSQGHRVAAITSAATALEQLRAAAPNILVLSTGGDQALRGILRQVRDVPEWRALPIICAESKGSAGDGVMLLDAGADDVLFRPLQPPIFLARVRTLLRRAVWSGAAAEDTTSVISAGPVEMRLISRQVLIEGRAATLTRLEFDLLAQLLRHPDRAFKRDELLAAVWNYPNGVETRTLDKHVESLRRKLGSASSFLQTVHGVGYRFSVPR